ncbi:MAG: hypothetical protein U0228_05425 [Myxococcaceae bacterium]
MTSRHVERLALPFFTAFVVGLGLSCTVNFTDDVHYACKKNEDCGGDGFVCAFGPTKAVCCKPTGTEVCDKKDNDCDGLTDNTGKAETCNGEDDDCNGVIDDGFDLQTNANHCGMCNHACERNENCRSGSCTVKVEAQCNDNFDDDGNGKTDCEDSTCDNRACGLGIAGCTCKNLKKAEVICNDNKDNDGDGVIDCVDSDCNGLTCLNGGCTCRPDGGTLESDCTDGVDNDQDGVKDCLDLDCVNQFCTPPDIYFTCTNDQKCKCNGGVQIAEVGSVLCRDNVDNDCDGQIDCVEASCTGQSCSPDGGAGCECNLGGKKETGCANLIDDDGDTKVDCADSDCVMGTTCGKVDGGAGSCTATGTCD